MPRVPWRRRREPESPRPAGRRRITRGLRRGGTLARRVLVGGRRNGSAAIMRMAEGFRQSRRSTIADGQHRSVGMIAPTSPAVPPVPAAEPAEQTEPPHQQLLLPGEHTRARLTRFWLVNACTAIGLGLGVVAIFLTLHGDLRAAAGCLLGYVACDGLDGALARRLGVSSPFGAQMDSLVDMACCGIAAPVMVYRWLDGSGIPEALLAPVCTLVAVCAAIRLARFNVSPKDGRYFSGIPTTIVAAILALATLMRLHAPVELLASAALLALLMVSSFPYAKVGQLRRIPFWLLLVPAAGALLDLTVTFLVLVGAYLASGPLLWLRHRRTA